MDKKYNQFSWIDNAPALLEIVMKLASLREGLENGSSAAEYAAAKLAAQAEEVVLRASEVAS